MNIKDIRKQTGLSQSKFAALLHIPVKTIQAWEIKGRTPPVYVEELIWKVLRYEGYIRQQ